MKKRSSQFVTRPAFGTAAAISMLALTIGGCVDNDYDLDNISKEVTIGGDEIILPLGRFSSSLDELLGDSIEGLEIQNGRYVFSFESDDDEDNSFSMEAFSVDPVDGISEIHEINIKVPTLPETLNGGVLRQEVEGFAMPDVDFKNHRTPDFGHIDVAINMELHDLSNFSQNGKITVPEIAAGQKVNFVHPKDGSNEVNLRTAFDKPEGIIKLGNLFFGGNENGSPLTVKIALNSLNNIRGEGSKLEMSITFPESYTLRNSDGTDIGHTLAINQDLKPEDNELEFDLFIYKKNLGDLTESNGQFIIDDEIVYTFNLEIPLKAGEMDLSDEENLPTFAISAEPSFKDLEVVLDKIDGIGSRSEVIENDFYIAGGIESVSYVAFNPDKTVISLSIDGLQWLPDAVADAMNVTLTLPDSYEFTETQKTIVKTLKQLSNEGVQLHLKGVDCNRNNGGITVQDGHLVISSQIEVAVSDVASGITVNISDMNNLQNAKTITTVIDMQSLSLDLDKSEFTLFSYVVPTTTYSFNQSVEIPEQIEGITRLEITNDQGNPVNVKFSLDSSKTKDFPSEKLRINNARIILDNQLRPASSTTAQGGSITLEHINGADRYVITIPEIVWEPDKDHVVNIAEFGFDAIENLEIENGQLNIDASITIDAEIHPEGVEFNEEEEINAIISVKVETDDIRFKSFTGQVNVGADDIETEIDLSDLGDIGIEIEDIGIAPEIELDVKRNDIPATAEISISLIPFDENGDQFTDDNGQPVEVATTIAIPGNQASHIKIWTKPGDGENVYQAELAKLFHGGIPSKIDMKMSVGTRKGEDITIDFARTDDYAVEYAYKVTIPFEFDATAMSYTLEADELNMDLPEGISVKEVAIVADFTSTIPFSLSLENPQILDADGNELETVKINLMKNASSGERNNAVKASKDGVTPAKSTLYLGIALADGDLGHLAEMDGIKLTFRIDNYDVDNRHSVLRPEQTIAAILKVQINGGITADLDSLIE